MFLDFLIWADNSFSAQNSEVYEKVFCCKTNVEIVQRKYILDITNDQCSEQTSFLVLSLNMIRTFYFLKRGHTHHHKDPIDRFDRQDWSKWPPNNKSRLI